jgi:hypothetical protein
LKGVNIVRSPIENQKFDYYQASDKNCQDENQKAYNSGIIQTADKSNVCFTISFWNRSSVNTFSGLQGIYTGKNLHQIGRTFKLAIKRALGLNNEKRKE